MPRKLAQSVAATDSRIDFMPLASSEPSAQKAASSSTWTLRKTMRADFCPRSPMPCHSSVISQPPWKAST
jgi:hypothetical protein